MKQRDVVLIGTLTGLVAGALAWSAMLHANRRDLFNRSPVRRLAALCHLAGRPSMAGMQMLREYIAWEPKPRLRARAKRQLRRMERALT